MRAAKHALSPDEISEFLRLYSSGLSVADIAPIMGVNTVTMYFRLRRAGVALRPREEAKHLPLSNAKRRRSLSGPNNPSFRGDKAMPHTGRHRAKSVLASAERCALCLIAPATAKRMERHHVDGNPLNNESSNLVWLCSKCHKGVHSHPRHKHLAPRLTLPYRESSRVQAPTSGTCVGSGHTPGE